MNSVWKFSLIFIMLFVLLNFQMIYAHEDAHYQIGKNHGCVDGEIVINWDISGYYTCKNYIHRTENIRLQETYLHSLNEVVGYNVQSMANTFLIGLYLVGLILIILFARQGDEK